MVWKHFDLIGILKHYCLGRTGARILRFMIHCSCGILPIASFRVLRRCCNNKDLIGFVQEFLENGPSC